MSEWRTIDSAPKDGRQVIVFCADGQAAIAEYYQRNDGFCAWEIGHDADGVQHFLLVEATHWMPLPEPPTKQESPQP